jgi:hypothetical protein
MRDPDLVQRAERAAGALERAWDRWRTMHGLGSEPLPPVSSYVGYSMEEPWGQPRVVFGVAADEAERLAAMLDGHDCYGPVHAEVAGRPDWRRMPATDGGTAAWAADDQLSIPRQARPHAADMLPPLGGARDLGGNADWPGPGDTSAHWERAATVAPGDEFLADVGPTALDAEPERGDHAESADAIGTRPKMTPQALAPLPPLPDPSPAGPVGSASMAPSRARKNTKASRGSAYRDPRYQGSSPRYKATPDSVGPAQADAEDAPAGSAVPATRAAEAGPADAADSSAAPSTAVASEAVAVPETAVASEAVGPDSAVAQDLAVDQEPALAPQAAVVLDPVVAANPVVAADPAVDEDAAKAADALVAEPAAAVATKSARVRSRQASKVNRARRQGPGAHEAWESVGEESADRSM